MRSAHVPILSFAIGVQNEGALLRSNQQSYRAHIIISAFPSRSNFYNPGGRCAIERDGGRSNAVRDQLGQRNSRCNRNNAANNQAVKETSRARPAPNMSAA